MKNLNINSLEYNLSWLVAYKHVLLYGLGSSSDRKNVRVSLGLINSWLSSHGVSNIMITLLAPHQYSVSCRVGGLVYVKNVNV